MSILPGGGASIVGVCSRNPLLDKGFRRCASQNAVFPRVSGVSVGFLLYGFFSRPAAPFEAGSAEIEDVSPKIKKTYVSFSELGRILENPS